MIYVGKRDHLWEYTPLEIWIMCVGNKEVTAFLRHAASFLSPPPQNSIYFIILSFYVQVF